MKICFINAVLLFLVFISYIPTLTAQKPDKIIKSEQYQELRKQYQKTDSLYNSCSELFKKCTDSSIEDSSMIYYLNTKISDYESMNSNLTDSIKLINLTLSNCQTELSELSDISTSNRDLLNQIKRLETELEKCADLDMTTVKESEGPKLVRFKNIIYDTYIVDLKNNSINFHWKNKSGKKYYTLSNVLDELKRNGHVISLITNGGMYTNKNNPVGLYVESGSELSPVDLTNPKNGLNFYLKPNGIFLIDNEGPKIILSEEYNNLKSKNKIQFATQSGPMLLIEGKMHNAFNKNSSNKYIRSGVGIVNSTKVVFAISNEPVNFYDFASLFKEVFYCKDALYLDGAISKMFLPDLHRYDQGGNFGAMISVVKNK